MKNSTLHATFAILVTLLLLMAGCGTGQQERYSEEELAPLIEAPPASPTVVDEGKPGVMLTVEGTTPAGRAFFVDQSSDSVEGAVILVHGSWGLDSEFRDVARTLAGDKFLVLAPDLLEGIVPSARLAVSELQAGIREERARAMIQAGIAQLRADPRLKNGKIAILASGPLGTHAYSAARHEPDLTVLALDTCRLPWDKTWLAGVSAPVLFFVGEENRGFSTKVKDTVLSAFKAAEIPLEIVEIPGAGTELLDPHAPGYSRLLRDQALEDFVARFEGM